jgi:hypothetical protein
VISLFGQYNPGKPSYFPDREIDREKYFAEALNGLVDHFEGTSDLVKIAVPCGLAGGNWAHYEEMLRNFETKMLQAGVNLEMTIYKLE